MNLQNIIQKTKANLMPPEWLRSYGLTASKILNRGKLSFEDYLNLADFIPGVEKVSTKQQIQQAVQPIKQKLDYFNPTSNAGQNFWSTPTAQGLGRIQQTPLKQYFLPTSSAIEAQAGRKFIGDTARNLVDTAKSAVKLTPGYVGYRATTGQPVSPAEYGTDVFNTGINALSTAYRINPLSKLLGPALGIVRQERQNPSVVNGKLDAKQMLLNMYQGGVRGLGEQPGVGETVTDNKKLAAVIDIAFMATMIAQPFVSKKLNQLNLKANEINEVSNTLGIKPNSSLGDFEQAWKSEVQKYPDVFAGKGTDLGKARVRELNNAWGIIEKTGSVDRNYATVYNTFKNYVPDFGLSVKPTTPGYERLGGSDTKTTALVKNNYYPTISNKIITLEERIANQKLANQETANLATEARSNFSNQTIKDINLLKKVFGSEAYQAGDVETFRNSYPAVTESVIQAVREVPQYANLTDSEALNVAITLPTQKATVAPRVDTSELNLAKRELSVEEKAWQKEFGETATPKEQLKNLSEYDRVFNKQYKTLTPKQFIDQYKSPIARRYLTGMALNLTNEQLLSGKWPTKEESATLKNKIVEEVLPNEELDFLFKKPGMDVQKKVHIFNYLSTPEQVLDKIGLTNEKKALRQGWDSYKNQLRSELLQINSWQDRVPGRDANKRIFNYLDGAASKESLNKEELQVASEVKTYLKGWADKLGLPEENRIQNYITHLFERTNEGTEFPVDIANKIKNQTAGSVYDPFLQKRMGVEDFVQDTWRSLEAYVKRGTRKFNLDPVLQMLKTASEKLDPATESYIKNYSHQINLRPTDLDSLLDNWIKQSPIGYKFTERPTAYLTTKWRQMVFRGALGLNVGSSLRNLTQGVNTYAKLGEKYTALGYVDTITHLIKNDFDELKSQNILDDNIVIDRELHATKRVLNKMDDALFFMFDMAEKINRSSAYFGAKRQALSKGLAIPDAIDYAKDIVRRTQFAYSNIDTPVAMGSDLVKSFTQFGTFPIKQTEFLISLAKDKNFKGLLRYVMASLFLTATVGKLFGLNLKEFVPFYSGRFTSPAGEAVSTAAGLFSSDAQRKAEAKKALARLLPLMIPGGVQLKKITQGAAANQRGYVTNQQGNVLFPIKQTPWAALQSLLFSPSATPESREYYGLNRRPLSESQTEEFKRYGAPYYQRLMQQRLTK